MTRDIIEQVALVTGRLLHRGTGEPIRGSIAIDAIEGSVIGKVLENGTFVVSGDPISLFRALGPAARLTVTIGARSAEFIEGRVTHTVTVPIPAAFAFNAPIDVGVLKLPVAPVEIQRNIGRTIRGQVTEAANPGTPIPATVEILQSGIVTNSFNTAADGRFGFDDLVVEAPAEIRCTAGLFKPQIRQLLIDYEMSVHEEHFRLVHV